MNDTLVQLFIQLIATYTGLHIRPQDRDALVQKIAIRMKAIKLVIPEKYYQFLEIDTEESQTEWRKLILLLTTTESYFLRDRGQFTLLEKVILPEIIERENQLKNGSSSTRSLRIWSAGCSTGEEPYSLAILLQKLIPDWQDWNILILGTDINEEALEKAKHGIYSPWSFRLVNSGLQQQYFNQHKGEWVIDTTLIKNVKFRYGNLVKDDYPNIGEDIYNMDLILCRNVFVYFEAHYIALVLKKFYNTLKNRGYLITGHAELHGQVLGQFRANVFPESVVYQRSELAQEELSRIPPSLSHQEEANSKYRQQLTQIDIRTAPQQRAVTELKSTSELSYIEPNIYQIGGKAPLSATLPTAVLSPSNNSKEIAIPPIKVSEPVQKFLPKIYKINEECETENQTPISSSLTALEKQNIAVENLLQEAENHFKNKAYDRAITKAEQAINFYPHNFDAYYLLAEIYANLGKYDRAINYCEEALEIDSMSVFPYYLLAHIAEEKGDLENTKSFLKKIIYICPSFISAYIELGNIYNREGNLKRATKMYDTSCEILKNLPSDTLIEQHGKMTANELLKYVKEVLLKSSIQ
ncbi:MAG TPA: CheR family methyltransferase [Kamptonema sp.]|nr:CheR family methyltransferase [Kamptonema sp.]